MSSQKDDCDAAAKRKDAEERICYTIFQDTLKVKTCEHLRRVFKTKWNIDHTQPWDSDTQRKSKLKTGIKISLMKDQIKMLASIEAWDITLVAKVLLHYSWKTPLSAKEKEAIKTIQKMRNVDAHGCVTHIAPTILRSYCTSLADSLEDLGVQTADLVKMRAKGGVRTAEANVTEAMLSTRRERCQEHIAIGDTYVKDDKYEEAMKSYDKAMRDCPWRLPELQARIHVKKAWIHFHRDRQEQAAAEADQATRCDHRFSEAFLVLSLAHKSQFSYANAAIALETAIALDESLAEKYNPMLVDCRIEAEKQARQEYDNPAYVPGISDERAKEMVSERQGRPFSRIEQLIELNSAHGNEKDRRTRESTRDTMAICLMSMRANGYIANKEYRDARELLMEGLEKFEYADFAYKLGLLYSRGQGVPRDVETANKYFRKATTMKPLKAQLDRYERFNGIGQSHTALGKYYLDVEGNEVQALEHFLKAQENYCASGCNMLGCILESGCSVCPQDMETAKDLYRKSWKINPMGGEAAFNLFRILLLSSPRSARCWLKAAADCGCPQAETLNAKLVCKVGAEEPLEMTHVDLPLAFKEICSSFVEIEARCGHNTNPQTVLLTIPPNFVPKTLYEKRCWDFRSQCIAIKDIKDVSSSAALIRGGGDVLNVFGVVLREKIAHSLQTIPTEPQSPDEAILKAFTIRSNHLGADVTKLSSLAKKFPQEHYILTSLGCLFAFDGASQNIDEAHRLLSESHTILSANCESDLYCDSLYNMAVISRIVGQEEESRQYYLKFLEHPKATGHRKVPLAHYALSCYFLDQIPSSSQEAENHFSKGMVAESKLLPTWQQQSSEHPTRKQAKAILKMRLKDFDDCTLPLYGGDLLQESSARISQRKSLTYLTRDTEVAYHGGMIRCVAKTRKKCDVVIPTSLARPTARSLQIEGLILIDEILATARRENTVFEKAILSCVVVSEAVKMTCVQLIVEDQERNFIEVAVYNHTPVLRQRLIPGQKVEINDPLGRLPRDGGPPLIRVDDLSRLKLVGEPISICWACSKQLLTVVGHSCKGCKKALYCDQDCQTKGWKTSHKYSCREYREGPLRFDLG